jgi:hypothetical protein
VEFGAGRTVELDLPRKGAGPDDDRDDRDESKAHEAARAPSEASAIKNEKTDYQSPDDGTHALQRSIQRA